MTTNDYQRIAQRHHDGMCDGACPECDRQQYEERQRDDTEERCASDGHRYAGDDGPSGRCYCGRQEYPRGGLE